MGEEPGGGSVEQVEIYDDFHRRVMGFIDPSAIRPLKVVVDGGNGMAGPMVGPLLEQLGLDLATSYWEPNGEFPDHEPNPLLPENREFIMAEVKRQGADLGIAWDGDADRCFFIDDTGRFVDGDFLTAILASSMLRKNPGETILYDVRASRAVPDIVDELRWYRADQPCRPRVLQVAHALRGRDLRRRGLRSLLLQRLLLRRLRHDPGAADPRGALTARDQALRAARADAQQVLHLRGDQLRGCTTRRRRWMRSPRSFTDAEQSHLDGISIDYPDWHFNVRASNTEPLLRLCLESLVSEADMEAKRDQVLALIRA